MDVDLVKEQIRIAAGLPMTVPDIPNMQLRGHAIECRINAEDPARNFAPSPGVITTYHAPGGPGVRVDSHAYQGYRVPANYDSLIGKLIVHAHDRDEAIARTKLALESYIIEGVHTTIPFLLELIGTRAFQTGQFDTKFLDRWMAERAAA